MLYLSPTYDGSVHDKQICNENPLVLPKGIFLWQDTGYQGHQPENALVLQPIKKPKGKELTATQKLFNTTISTYRVRVEHSIAGIKRLRIVKERLRQFKTDCRDFVMKIACGLHNFRVSKRTLTKQPILACKIT